MIDNVPLIQNANDAQQINASIIAMKKASRELDEKIAQFNKLLSQEITNREKAITEAINSLDVASVGGSGKYISAISETDGKISATESEITSTVSSGNSQPVTSGGVAEAIANKQERYYFSRLGLNNKRYVLIGTADGSAEELASMSCDISLTCRNYINANSFYYAKFTIHLDINFENLQSILCVKGWTDCNLASSNNLNVGVVITKSGTTSYLYLDCTDPWFSATLIPLTAVTSASRFIYQLPPTEENSLIGDIVYNSRADATQIAQVCWKELDINYQATAVSTSRTKIKDNIPEFNEAVIVTSGTQLFAKRTNENTITITSSMRYTLGGDWDDAYDFEFNFETHTLWFRQTIKGSQANFTIVKKMYYR